MFFECISLKNIIIPNSTTTIQGSAFYGCSNLEKIIIPKTIKSIGDNVFKNCTKLTIYFEGNYPSKLDRNWNPSHRPVVLNYTDN